MLTTGKDGRRRVIGGCNREQWYRRKGLAATEPGNTNWSLSAVQGNYLHTMMSDLLSQYGFSMGISKIAEEQGFYDARISLSGRIDYLAWDADLLERDICGYFRMYHHCSVFSRLYAPCAMLFQVSSQTSS